MDNGVGGSLEKMLGRNSQFSGSGTSSVLIAGAGRNILYQRTRNHEGPASILMTHHLCPQPPRKLNGIHKRRVRPQDINPVSWMSRRFFILREHHTVVVAVASLARKHQLVVSKLESKTIQVSLPASSKPSWGRRGDHSNHQSLAPPLKKVNLGSLLPWELRCL